jgi:glycosyltransferase involved in cell wall biosynthesis
VPPHTSSMRIAQVAPPFESVPPAGYGGTERVVSVLTEELVERGHDVTLFAPGDSKTKARLVPSVSRALWHQKMKYHDFTPFWAVVLGQLVQALDQFDVIHSHLDYFGFPLARLAPCPVVTTLHGRLDLPEMLPLYQTFPDVPLVSISDAQRAPVPTAGWVGTVYHGIQLDQFSFSPERGDYLVFLGRIAPEKGLDTAIRVAQRAGVPLKVAARKPLPFTHDPENRRDWEYYNEHIKPLLRESGVEFVGEVAGEGKSDVLRQAAALLFPIRWPEPFGLVMVEALACGTPVLALRGGSVPEVITDGVTGRVCDSDDELVQAVQQIDRFDRARCRAEAEQRFSPTAMAVNYEQVYSQLTSNGRPVNGQR